MAIRPPARARCVPQSFVPLLRPLLVAALWLAALSETTAAAAAQEPATAPAGSTPPQGAPAPLDDTTRMALERLARLLADQRAARERALASGDATAALEIDQELQRLSWEFAALVARLDVKEFESPEQRRLDLQRELEELVRPLLQTIKDATEEPRQIADLRARIDLLQEQLQTARRARAAADTTLARLPASSVARAEVLRELELRWLPRIESLEGQLLVLRARLLARQERVEPLLDRVTHGARAFLQSSGLTLLLTVLVAVGVHFGLRQVLTRGFARLPSRRGFSLRLAEVLLHLTTATLTLLAALLVPYLRNDWFLLAIAIVFLLGVGWVLARALPHYFDQLRLMLNIGSVREGERILIDGLPYRVESLRFYSRLDNPALDGGRLRVPIHELLGLRSRPAAADEPWFPCRRGDVVALADGTVGTVVAQTPEQVVLTEPDGARRTWPTAKFLELAPRTLSGGFVVRATFAVDRGEARHAATRVPELLAAELRGGLQQAVGADELRDVRVEFAATDPVAFRYEALATFGGASALRYRELERSVQRLLLLAATQHGVRLPVPQLVLHRGAAERGDG